VQEVLEVPDDPVLTGPVEVEVLEPPAFAFGAVTLGIIEANARVSDITVRGLSIERDLSERDICLNFRMENVNKTPRHRFAASHMKANCTPLMMRV